MQRTISIFGALALLTAASTVAGAVTNATGTVMYIYPASNIVKLHDGRHIYLEPGTTFTVDGRQVSIDQIKPGMRVSINGGREATAQDAASTQSAASSPSAVARVPGHPPVDAVGSVAHFDPQSHVVTFQDGRMLKLGPSSSVWMPGQASGIRPGAQVFVRDGQPAGYRTAWDAASMPRHRMGTVVNVDPASALVILSDGTVVRVTQATRVQSEGRAATLADLQPGDEVVMVGRHTTASEGGTAGMASPGTQSGAQSGRGSQVMRTQTLSPYFNATFEASDIHLMRRKQAP